MFRFYDWKCFESIYETEKSQYEITIVDDDFIEIEMISVGLRGNGSLTDIIATFHAIINTYSRRNLNVAGNLVLLMQFIEHKWPSMDIKWQIEICQQFISEYREYHDQVMDYLIFW